MAESNDRQSPHPVRSGAVTVSHPDLEWRETVKGSKPGDRFVRIATHRGFTRVGRGHLVPRAGTGAPTSPLGRALQRVSRVLIGRPLASSEEPHERLNIFTGLAVFASDNISSSAYATEEIMRVLVLAGAGVLSLTMPITLVIVLVLAIVVISYQQTIRAYPSGGGSYIVASDNLGPLAGLTAAGALLVDYVLTVSVSIAAGVAALTSIFPGLFDYRVAAGIAFVVLLTLGNLRGIRESGTIFTAPTYVYLLAIYGLLAYGLYRFVTGTLPEYQPPTEWLQAEHGTEALGVFLILRAFSAGSVALTGTEAVSNGVPAFKPLEWRNARIVLIAMGTCFGSIFLGMSFLAGQLGIVPDPTEEQTVISQLTSLLVGAGSPFHYLVQVSTALLLVLAANTAFADFPRLASILARDRFVPRIFQFRGDRLAFTGGIVLLAAVAGMLIVAFGGSVTNLIPLYTVGVFVAFTLSQSGMVRHWWKLRAEEPGWRWRAAINGVGAATTGIVAIEVAISKFALGAWMVLVLVPILIGIMWSVRQHYTRLEGARLAETPVVPEEVVVRTIVPVAELGVPARQALAYARAVAADDAHVVAVHVTDDVASAADLRRQWREWEPGVEMVIIESPFRSLTGPLLAYIDALKESNPQDTITVVLPEYVPSRWWEHLLHNQTALRLKAALLFHPGVVVTNVPYHMATRPSA
ncbi:MAG TPA: APC family permease [Chloroflexota bacterium]